MPADLHLLPKFRDRLSYLYVEHAVVERDQNSIVLYQKVGEPDEETAPPPDDREEERSATVRVPIADVALLMLGTGHEALPRGGGRARPEQLPRGLDGRGGRTPLRLRHGRHPLRRAAPAAGADGERPRPCASSRCGGCTECASPRRSTRT